MPPLLSPLTFPLTLVLNLGPAELAYLPSCLPVGGGSQTGVVPSRGVYKCSPWRSVHSGARTVFGLVNLGGPDVCFQAPLKRFPSPLKHKGTAKTYVIPFSDSTHRGPSTGVGVGRCGAEFLCFQKGGASLDRGPKAQGPASEPREPVSRGNSFPFNS